MILLYKLFESKKRVLVPRAAFLQEHTWIQTRPTRAKLRPLES